MPESNTSTCLKARMTSGNLGGICAASSRWTIVAFALGFDFARSLRM